MSGREQAVAEASALMREFAERTGLTSERPAQRYLWTDAFDINEVMLASCLVPDGVLGWRAVG